MKFSGVRHQRCSILKPCMRFHESNVIIVKFHMGLQSTDFVLVVVPHKILISRTSTRTSTKRIRLNRIHTPPQARNDTSNFKFSGVPPASSTLYYVDRMKLQFLFRSDRPSIRRMLGLYLYKLGGFAPIGILE